MSIDLVSDPYVTELADSAIYADVRFGDNGSLWGMGEHVVGTPTTEVVGLRTWEGEPFQGPINSGWFAVQLHVRADGWTSWYIQGGDEPLQLWSEPIDNISQVQIQAAAETMGLRIEWRSIGIEFFRDGVQTEAFPVAYDLAPHADTTGENWSHQQILTIVPTEADNDEVIITGHVFLHVAEGYWPYGTELFGRIAIYA